MKNFSVTNNFFTYHLLFASRRAEDAMRVKKYTCPEYFN